MKNKWIFIVLLISGCSYSAEYTDMAEFSIKGNPKTVITSVYENFYAVNGEWVPADEYRYVSYFEMKVDENGMIGEILNRDFNSETGNYDESRTVFSFKDGKKSSGKIYNENWEINEFFTCHWIDDRIYETHGFTNECKLKFTQKNFLDENFRDQSGNFNYFNLETGEIIFNEDYRNERDGEGNLTGSFSTNKIKNEKGRFEESSVNVEYKNLSRDKYGNIVKSLMFEKGNKEPKRLIIRKIFYYDE